MIDRIDIKERAARQEAAERKAKDGKRGAFALGWFAEYAETQPKPHEAITVRATPCTCSTPMAETAQYYLSQAALECREGLLARAIQLAAIDLKEAET